jgi:hypothetical protein
MQIKAQTILPPGTPITKVDPGRAHGLKKPMMRAKTERGTAAKLPPPAKPRSKKPYEYVLQDLREPGIKVPKGYIKPVGLPWNR